MERIHDSIDGERKREGENMKRRDCSQRGIKVMNGEIHLAQREKEEKEKNDREEFNQRGAKKTKEWGQ